MITPRSTRPIPVRAIDFPEVPLAEFELVLDAYRQMHRFGIPRADARRETRVTLELLAWARIRQVAAAKKAKAGRR